MSPPKTDGLYKDMVRERSLLLGEEHHNGVNAFGALPAFDQSVTLGAVHGFQSEPLLLRSNQLLGIPAKYREQRLSWL